MMALKVMVGGGCICQMEALMGIIRNTFLTSEAIPVATGAGGRGGPLGSDDRSKGTLLFDSRKHRGGEWEDGRSAGGADCWT